MITDISLIVTAIGVLGAVFGLRQNYLERLRQFELKYIDRYWLISDRLSLPALCASNATPTTEDKKAIRSYFYLCEDELDMRGHGYISDDTYRMWVSAIRTQLDQPMFKTIWNEVLKEADERGHPFASLHELMTNEKYDPLSMPAFARFVRGLKGAPRVARRAALAKPEVARDSIKGEVAARRDADSLTQEANVIR